MPYSADGGEGRRLPRSVLVRRRVPHVIASIEPRHEAWEAELRIALLLVLRGVPLSGAARLTT